MSTQPEILYIYCSLESAKKRLASSSVMAQSPICMDNPLLPNLHSSVSFTHEDLLKSSTTFAVGMIFSPVAPRGDSPIVNAIRRWRDEQRFSSTKEAEPVLRDLLTRMIDHRMQQVDKRILEWRSFVQNARVVRTFSKADNLHNWHHHADKHQGVVLGFKTEEAMLLANAKPADYTALRPDITSLKEQLNLLFQYQKQEKDTHFSDMLYSRPPQWRDENEWLSEQAPAKTAQGTNTDKPSNSLKNAVNFHPEELASLRFGFRVGEAERKQCLSLIKQQFSAIQCYCAKLTKGKYELEFEKMK